MTFNARKNVLKRETNTLIGAKTIYSITLVELHVVYLLLKVR